MSESTGPVIGDDAFIVLAQSTLGDPLKAVQVFMQASVGLPTQEDAIQAAMLHYRDNCARGREVSFNVYRASSTPGKGNLILEVTDSPSPGRSLGFYKIAHMKWAEGQAQPEANG